MASDLGDDIPQWKKDLILRKRIKCLTGTKQLWLAGPPLTPPAAIVRVGQQPNQAPTAAVATSSTSAVSTAAQTAIVRPVKCNVAMVQERVRSDHLANGNDKNDSDSSEEDLHYGPGIVNKLKNRYLSLTLRESNAKSRPSILGLRKATSLENLLEGEEETVKKPEGRLYESKVNGSENGGKNVPNRYRSRTRGEIMKRAHSIETISRGGNLYEECKPKRESLHEEMLIIAKEPEEKLFASRVNRPKRIAPIMNEKEKPPADVVKQVKRIFEGRPEQRTKPPHATGEVAAKVATYKSIIVQTKVNKKPLVKQKPLTSNDKLRKATPVWKTSHIPDVSRTNHPTEKSLPETPDLILHSSPAITSPRYRLETTQKFLYEEIKTSDSKPVRDKKEKSETDACQISPKFISKESRNNISKSGAVFTYNFSSPPTSPIKPLKLDVGFNVNGTADRPKAHSSPLVIPAPSVSAPPVKPTLTVREIEKNKINSAKTLEKPVVKTSSVDEGVGVIHVPKVKKPARVQLQEQKNSIVFKFTDRQEVPDYVGNDGRKRTAKIERPKAGEGGIILLPGASIDESLLDDEDDWMRSLEGPPSPCDVTFINDNILIDGRSSLNQKVKKQKLKISFVEAVPEIFEYPSENSMLDDSSVLSSTPSPVNGSSAALGHTVPSLGGSTLANYTPKSGSSGEDFQLGVTRTVVSITTAVAKLEKEETSLQIEEPMLFSAGTNSDILF